MLLSIFREGKIAVVDILNQDGRCGAIGTPCHYAYKVEISVKKENLLPNSFIVDVDEIRDYFIREYDDKTLDQCPSCEIMAMNAVEFFKNLMGGNRAETISCLISPGEGRGITASIKKINDETYQLRKLV